MFPGLYTFQKCKRPLSLLLDFYYLNKQIIPTSAVSVGRVRFSSSDGAASSSSAPSVPSPKPTAAELAEFARQNMPIEKQSLTRGMGINAFEKDFIIYPEYGHNLEQERIKKFVNELDGDLQIAYDQLRTESPTSQEKDKFPAKVHLALAKHKVSAAAVPCEFGGMGFCHKDMLQLSECLGGQDLNLLSTYGAFSLATSLIIQYGTTEQKEHYLPGIASGQWRPAVCIDDETTGPQSNEHVFSAKGQHQFLSATKINVQNARNANLFIVFANRKVGDLVIPACYLIEPDTIVDQAVSSIKIRDQMKTGGLQRCNFSTVVFENVPLREWMLLGSNENAGYLTDELSVCGRIAYGAGIVGHLKKVLANLCHFANQQIKGNLRLSDSHPIQRSLTELGLITYVLESVVYYIAGMIDEELFLMQDIENAIVQRLCNRALRQSITTIAEVCGFAATNTELCFEQPMRDAVAMLAQSEPDLHLIRRISIPTLETYVNKFGGMAQFRSAFSTQKMFKLRMTDTREQDFLEPAIIHYIAEHVHPSLEPAASGLENSMSRLGQLFDKVCTEKGVHVNTDYIILGNVCEVMENLLAMTATIARSSRSYAIGLRGAENEIEWTIMFCLKASEDAKNIISDTLKNESFLRMNPRLTGVGQGMLQYNGYFPESPLEKNW
ncbi:hypothetical protein niasHT_021245 [Heterodera trifolii]|uniref:Acyl-CoA dehydrogenase n=1 Tax=Heterodera trifolii TaxID=157864 RepID=A0ABD2K5X4_9BILA